MPLSIKFHRTLQEMSSTTDALPARREVDELRSKLTEQVKLLEEKASAITELQSKLAEHMREKSSILAVLQSARQEVDDLQSKQTEHIQDRALVIADLRREVDELQSKLTEHIQDKASVIADLQSTRREVDRLQIKLTEQAEVVRHICSSLTCPLLIIPA